MAELIRGAQYPVNDENTGITCIVTARVSFRNCKCNNCGKEILKGEEFGSFGRVTYCSDCTRRGKTSPGGKAS